MARLSRVHFAGLGTDSARFNPVTLDFRDAQGRASHAVMWLRNGGGKTTMLSFLYSTLRPHSNDWLGRHNGRQTELLEYVKDRQTGYVLLEFEFPALGVRRVIGQAISKRSARDPKRWYFTFRADGVLPWESIPVTGLGEPANSVEQFLDRVQTAGEQGGAMLEFYKTERQGEWRTHLESIGLDPEIYHTHLLMNADEGGLLNFFDFQSPETFIEKLLDMAFETVQPVEGEGKADKEDLAAVIEKFRQKVFGRPNLEATATFCQQALAALEALRTELEVAAQFRQQREAYRMQAARLLLSVNRHLEILQSEQKKLEAEKDVSAKAKREATNRRDEHKKFQKHYERRRRLLAITEAQVALAAAEQSKVREENWMAALRTAHRRRRLAECERQIAAYTLQKQALEKAHEPDRQALERWGRTISDLLGRRIAELDARLTHLTGVLSSARDEQGRLQAERLTVGKESATTQQALTAVREFLNEVDGERRRLREQKVLLPPAESGAEAVKRWQEQVQAHTEQAGRLSAEIDVADTRIAALRGQAKEKEGEKLETSREISRLGTWLESVNTQAARLRSEPMIVRELGENSYADLHNPSLESALSRFADDCQRTALAKSVEGAADHRIVAHCRAHPNTPFPAPVGIEEVIAKLRSAGVTSAISAYRWLSENCEAGEAAQRLLAQPALYAGIVVQVPAQLAAARTVIVAEGLDLPVMVGTPADFAAAELRAVQHVVLPEEKGFFSATLAQINLARVANRAAGREAEVSQLNADHKATEGVLGRLREHVRTYPTKLIDDRRNELTTQEQLRAAQDIALEGFVREIGTLTDRVKDLRWKKETQEKAMVSAREHLARAQAFVANFEARVPAKREEERKGIAALQQLATRESALALRLGTLADSLPETERQINSARFDQQGLALRREMLPAQFIGAEPEPGAGEDLVTLTDTFEARRRDYEGRVQASYFDAKVEEEQRRKTEIETERLRDAARPPEADVELALTEPDLGKAVDEQSGKLALVAVDVSTARRTWEQAEADRPPQLAQSERDTPHPELGLPGTSAQATDFAKRCENWSLEFDGEADRADQNLTLVAFQLETKNVACARYESLPARLRRITGESAADDPSAEFQGDEAKDRALVEALEANSDSAQVDLERAQKRAAEVYNERYLAVFQLRELEGRTIDLVERMRRLPRNEVEERTGFWVEEIRTHSRVVAQELADFEKERQTVLGLMNDCVRDAEAVLRAAETRSRMPDTLGAWAGHAFLRIKVPPRHDQPERLVLLGRMLGEWIDAKNPKPIPAGAKLAHHCLVAVAGKGQIEVRILKPEYNLRPFQHDIVKLKSFSGGEQVTAAIILYCIIVKLRSQRRGRATSLAEDSGFLLLDNPLGKANLPDFVDLQISMADRMGVQFICGTGINDLDALAGFPKVIRLRNSSINPRTGANIVEVAGQEFSNINAVSFGTNGHGKTGA